MADIFSTLIHIIRVAFNNLASTPATEELSATYLIMTALLAAATTLWSIVALGRRLTLPHKHSTLSMITRLAIPNHHSTLLV